MKELLIATNNPGKLKELLAALADLKVSLRSLKNFPDLITVLESGKTFEENAILKAKWYEKQTLLPTIGDDGGLEIDALGGEPGVKSRRWIHGDRESTDQELIDYALERLKGVPYEKRTARLRTVVAFYDGQETVTKTAAIEGRIVEKAPLEIEAGYPYRSLFFIEKFGKLYKDLTPKEHEEINHRIKALNELKPIIRKALKI